MNIAAAIIAALIKYGPTVIETAPTVKKLYDDFRAGQGAREVTPDEWAALLALGNETAEDIYARLGITPPPPAGA